MNTIVYTVMNISVNVKKRTPAMSTDTVVRARIVQVPNATTVEAMKELDDGKGQRFDSAEELFRDLEI